MSVSKMVEDLPNNVLPGDERNDAKFRAAVAKEWVGFVNSSDQICPPSCEGSSLLGSKIGLFSPGLPMLGGCGLRYRAVVFSESACPRRVGSVVVNII